MQTAKDQLSFCGREFSTEEVSLIQEVVETCAGLSRLELAHTVCELLDWKRPGGGLKARECRDLLERLERQGVLTLPDKKLGGSSKARKLIAPVGDGQVHSTLTGSVEEFAPLDVQIVESRQQRQLFKVLVSRYHYLGYAMPYGARLQYLIYVSRPRREVVGCVQFSSPAWRMKVRDQWIGWDDVTRKLRLQHIVNNSRLLVVARIRNLASMALSGALKRLRADWRRQYGVEPWLVETLVDREQFHGGCYRAANFIVVGETSGRGRMDCNHRRHGAQIKTVLVYPLVKDATRWLRDGV
ncbi:MAG: DUF4338 domain-containing protein [Desulfobacterales bacterium]|nr:MAG: DUF4338 domain-containing protein [Desulfobacterales bacterium]